MFFERGKGAAFNYSIELSLPKQTFLEAEPSPFDKNYVFSETGKMRIPASVFRQGMSGLQGIVKYLFEVQGLSYVEIANALSRDQRTIWSTYKSVEKKKFKDVSAIEKDVVLLDSDVLNDRNFSVLEAASVSLRRKGYSLTKTAELLGKSPKTIWTVLDRAQKKMVRLKTRERGGRK